MIKGRISINLKEFFSYAVFNFLFKAACTNDTTMSGYTYLMQVGDSSIQLPLLDGHLLRELNKARNFLPRETTLYLVDKLIYTNFERPLAGVFSCY
jgi:hypothetical protein